MAAYLKGKSAFGTAAVLTFAIVLSACSGGGNASPSSEATPNASPAASPTAASAASPSGSPSTVPPIDWEARKAENAKAGKIIYTTGYYYAASPPDLEAVVADELGYFKELGLNVEIQGGLDSEGMKFLAAGRAQIASAGAPSLVIQSVASGAGIKGVATFGAQGNGALMVMDDSDIRTPADLVGKTIGFHGALPPNYTAMLKNAGVDPSKVKGVSVGYDPTVLSSGKIDALTVYKSNEPFIMEQAGKKVRLIDPGDYGASTSFAVVAVNDKFAESYPAAVVDFLRALAKAHEWALQNEKDAIAMLEKRSQSAYNVKAETYRWETESKIVESSKHAGHGVGWQTDDQWDREIRMLTDAAVVKQAMSVADVMDNRYIDAIYNGDKLIWPGQ